MDEDKINQGDVRSYFTKEVEDRIAAVSDEQMLILLRELEATPFWLGILKYNQNRLRLAQDSLLFADPVKDPTSISRSQGVMLGVSDLQNAVIILKLESQKREAEINKGEE
jgi:uncharacterized small protein (DUF1192 family)